MREDSTRARITASDQATACGGAPAAPGLLVRDRGRGPASGRAILVLWTAGDKWISSSRGQIGVDTQDLCYNPAQRNELYGREDVA